MSTTTGTSDPLGLFYTWWRGDSLPVLPGVHGIAIDRLDDHQARQADLNLDPMEIMQRLEQGHHLYVAQISGALVGWGWSATRAASIGELDIHMTMPPGNRYLWDFVTLPEWRGQGIYGHILQAMVHDQEEIQRFWVGHDYDNTASGRGILRAGFALVVELYRDQPGFYLKQVGPPERAIVAADLLGVPLRNPS
jgi:GNAT superfamily N-acetyltransferase